MCILSLTRFQRELKARKNNNFAAVSVFPADFFLFKKEMSSGDYLDNFEDEEEFSDDDDDVRESKNFYNEGLGLGHVRRLEQENEVSRANSTDRELKLIGEPSMKKPRFTQSANKRKKSLIPTPNLLNKSDPSVLLSESFAAYFPKKCNKNVPKSPSKPNIFEKLSDEVIVKIFSYISHFNLSRVSLVCHRFRRIAGDETLWKRASLYMRQNVPNGTIGTLLARGVSYLKLSKTTLCTPLMENKFGYTYKSIIPSKLIYLDLSEAILDATDLEDILSTCHYLKKLTLESVPNIPINDLVCDHIVQNADCLEVLNLNRCEGLTFHGVKKIVSHCSNLVEFNIGWTDLCEKSVTFLCENLTPKVKKLNLEGCRTTLTNDNVLQLVSKCNTLEELDLSDSSSLESPAICAIVEYLHNCLKSISLSRCFAVLPEDYLRFSAMAKLQFLNIYGMLPDHSLDVIKKKLPKVFVNECMFGTIARPATGSRKNVLWDIKFSKELEN